MKNLGVVLLHLYPAANPTRDFRVQDDGDGRGPRIVRWDAEKLGPQPTSDVLFAAEAAALDAVRVRAIKAAARQVILARYPEWRQANMTARAVELLDIRSSRAWTSEEDAGAQALRAAWGWIKTVRGESDRAEATPGMTADQVVWP